MKTKNIVIVALIFAVVLYLLGSFVVASFDIKKWSPDARFLVSALWLGVTCIIIGIKTKSIND